jgi:hypothetical protein
LIAQPPLFAAESLHLETILTEQPAEPLILMRAPQALQARPERRLIAADHGFARHVGTKTDGDLTVTVPGVVTTKEAQLSSIL